MTSHSQLSLQVANFFEENNKTFVPLGTKETRDNLCNHLLSYIHPYRSPGIGSIEQEIGNCVKGSICGPTGQMPRIVSYVQFPIITKISRFKLT